MTPIGTIASAYGNPALMRLGGAGGLDGTQSPAAAGMAPAGLSTTAPSDGFGTMISNLVSSVDAKQTAANTITNKVMLGESGQLHQSVIAMQEASVAFSLMVQVRNKLVESYQELMRMQV